MTHDLTSTLRLNLPQWQGGNRHDYYFGANLLAWLAPESDGPEETVFVPEPQPGETLEVENGTLARSVLLQQARDARSAIEKHQPDRIVTLGGDCLADLGPMAYLNTRYGGNLGVLWVDAHPDILTPKDSPNGHTHVLAALLGKGDPELVSQVETPVKVSHVMYAGLDDWSFIEGDAIRELGLRHSSSSALRDSSAPVLEWLKGESITHLAVHFDIDVIDPRRFSPVIFNDPNAPKGALEDVPRGRMTPEQVVRLLSDVAAACDMVGLTITEYLPWEAIETRKLLRELPLLGG